MRPEDAGAREVYPAVFPFRIIVDARAGDGEGLRAAVASYRVTEPLAPSRVSGGEGRYRSFSVSVELSCRAEMEAFDGAVRRVPGVRLVL